MADDRLLTFKELAWLLGYSRRTLSRLIKRGMPRYRNRATLSEVKEWLRRAKKDRRGHGCP